jgi:UDP-GlcNAc:undecaprenyl-phosphate GlcNAc-1-phosphate transferase
MSALVYLLTLAIPLAGTTLLLPQIVRLAHARGWLDEPGGRKQHGRPIPRLGGISFFLAFMATVLIGFVLAPHLTGFAGIRAALPNVAGALSTAHNVKLQLFGLLAGACVMFVVGLVDDLLGDQFPVGFKFSGQCLAAAIPVACGIQVEFTGIAALNVVLSFLWILGISNAFNLLDNMDGLSAGVAVCSAFIFFLNALALGEIFLCLILAAFVGALLGFLRFNLHPAKVFMGDCGALFIGFTLSSLTILEHYVSPASSTLFPVLMPVLVLSVPLIDTLSVIVIRVRDGRPVYRGDRCHLSHRLVASGLAEPQAVKFLFLMTLALGMGALNLAHASVARTLWTATYSTAAAVLVLSGLRIGTQWNGGRAGETAPVRRSTTTAEGL